MTAKFQLTAVEGLQLGIRPILAHRPIITGNRVLLGDNTTATFVGVSSDGEVWLYYRKDDETDKQHAGNVALMYTSLCESSKPMVEDQLYNDVFG